MEVINHRKISTHFQKAKKRNRGATNQIMKKRLPQEGFAQSQSALAEPVIGEVQAEERREAENKVSYFRKKKFI